MTETNRMRKPSWFSVMTTVLGVFFLSSLGVWQLQRAEEKKQIQYENESRKSSAPVAFSFPISDPTSLRFKRIQVQGKFISDKQFVLDNQVLDRAVGYNILTPFKLANSTNIVLVDRGWVPLTDSRDHLPNIAVNEDLRSLVGMVYVPYGKAFSLGEIDNGTKTWPRLIQFIDFEALETRLGENLLPLTLRMDANQKDVFKAQWALFTASPKRHLGYAVQWFSLALTLLVIFIVLHLPKSTKNSN